MTIHAGSWVYLAAVFVFSTKEGRLFRPPGVGGVLSLANVRTWM